MKVIILTILLFFVSCSSSSNRCIEDCENTQTQNEQSNNHNGFRFPLFSSKNESGSKSGLFNWSGFSLKKFNFSPPSFNVSPGRFNVSPGRFNASPGRFKGWSKPFNNSFNSKRTSIPAGRTHNWSKPRKWRL